MNYLERLALELESRKSQLKTLRQKDAELACIEIEKEIEQLSLELKRYQAYEAGKAHHFHQKQEN